MSVHVWVPGQAVPDEQVIHFVQIILQCLPFLLVPSQTKLWLTLAIGVLLRLSLLAGVEHKHLGENPD